jgi:hypothetical protein
MKKQILTTLALGLTLNLAGCATISDAYNSTANTVKGWVTPDTPKQADKKPEVKPESKPQEKNVEDVKPSESKAN